MKEKGQTGDRVDQTVRPGSAPKSKSKRENLFIDTFRTVRYLLISP